MDLRKNFGRQHAKHRRAAGFTQQGMAEVMGYAVKTVQAMEQGLRTPTIDYATRADSVLGLEGVLRNLAELCQADSSPFGSFLEHEQRATLIRTYAPMLVHGLVQTQAYARAVMEATAEQPDIDDGLRTRMARQAILDRPDPPRLHVILDESVLWRVIGDDEVLHGQLARLGDLPPSVAVQVLPRTSGAHPGVDGSLTILEFEDETPVINVSGWRHSAIIDAPAEVKTARESFERLAALALPPDLSAEMIEYAMENPG